MQSPPSRTAKDLLLHMADETFYYNKLIEKSQVIFLIIILIATSK